MTNDGRGSGAGSIIRGFPSTMGDDHPLNVPSLMRHAARTFGEQEIVYRRSGAGFDRCTYRQCYERICRGAQALRSIGVGPGDRVGVLDWNGRRYFELYCAIPAIGAVLLQLNLRLNPEELGFILAHSGASVLCVDESLLPLAEALAPGAPGVKAWVVMSDRAPEEIVSSLRPSHHYEQLLAAATADFEWPLIDERSAYAAAYTSGTTGRPKGVYYSHRSAYLHALSASLGLGLSLEDTMLMLTPMYHAQGWGLPQTGPLCAAKLVLPGRYSTEDIGFIVDTMIAEEVTVASCVPSLLLAMLAHIERMPQKPDFGRLRLLCGGAQPPLAAMLRFEELTGGVVMQAYGATETSPLVAINRAKPSLRKRLSADARLALRTAQGLPSTGVDIKILDAEDRELPHDGKSVGEICVRGPWCTTSYHELPAGEARFIGGYWRSGDVGCIDPHGYIKLTDRLKDVIKSGGEWISSIDMENALVAHPAVAEAVVVGIPHPKWDERPLALVVLKAGAVTSDEALREHLLGQFAKWQLPDQIRFVERIAKTSVGKLDKKLVRAEYATLYSA